jgi:CTP synthase
VASQFHPEFISRPNRPQALFRDFVKAASQAKNGTKTTPLKV